MKTLCSRGIEPLLDEIDIFLDWHTAKIPAASREPNILLGRGLLFCLLYR